MPRPTHIYALIDPRNGRIRYVGKTCMTVEKRLSVHISLAKKTHTYSARWICGLLSEGLKPRWTILETVDGDWQMAEKDWIAKCKAQGMSLTNLTSGGDGAENHKHSAESRLKMSVAVRRWLSENPNPNKGKKRAPEVIEKTARAHRGRPKSEAQRKKISETLKGSVLSQETRAKISAANKGKPKPPRSAEHAQRIADGNRGRKHSAETREKMSRAHIGMQFSEAHRRALSEAATRRYAVTP